MVMFYHCCATNIVQWKQNTGKYLDSDGSPSDTHLKSSSALALPESLNIKYEDFKRERGQI